MTPIPDRFEVTKQAEFKEAAPNVVSALNSLPSDINFTITSTKRSIGNTENKSGTHPIGQAIDLRDNEESLKFWNWLDTKDGSKWKSDNNVSILKEDDHYHVEFNHGNKKETTVNKVEVQNPKEVEPKKEEIKKAESTVRKINLPIVKNVDRGKVKPATTTTTVVNTKNNVEAKSVDNSTSAYMPKPVVKTEVKPAPNIKTDAKPEVKNVETEKPKASVKATPKVNAKLPTLKNNEDKESQIKTFDKTLQQLYYQLGDPSVKDKTKVKSDFEAVVKTRQKLIDEINLKGSDIGFVDKLINNLPKNGIISSTAFNKYGISDELQVRDSGLPKFETFAEKKSKDEEVEKTSKKYEDLTTDSSSPYLKFRYSASNSNPVKVNTYSSRGDRKERGVKEIKGKGVLMHFLDENPMTGWQHENTMNFKKRQEKDDYVGVLIKNKDGEFVNYVQKKYVKPKDKTFLVRQMKFDDIDFNKKIKDDNFGGHTYWGRKSKANNDPAIPVSSGANPNIYDKTSGQSVVFIFKYKGDTRYVHFSNSPNAIIEEGNRIKKYYKLKENELIVGLGDAGSFSASVKGDNNVVTNKNLMDNYYNGSESTGAGMTFE